MPVVTVPNSIEKLLKERKMYTHNTNTHHRSLLWIDYAGSSIKSGGAGLVGLWSLNDLPQIISWLVWLVNGV
jgi:hypothetical protein